MIGDFLKGLFSMIWAVVIDHPDPKADFLSVFPTTAQPFVSVVLSITPIMLVFPGLFALTTWLERKALGRIQNRLGPNRVGPYGLFQPVADGLKMVTKEDIVPRNADKLIHFLAPVVLVVPTLLAYAVLPFGRNLVPIDLDAGILFFFAVGASTELSVFMVFAARRHARHRPDDQLRNPAHHFVGDGDHARRVAVPRPNRRPTGRPFLFRLGAALERFQTLGFRGLRHFPDCLAGRIKPFAV
jgi:hypothetical protein